MNIRIGYGIDGNTEDFPDVDKFWIDGLVKAKDGTVIFTVHGHLKNGSRLYEVNASSVESY